MMYNLEHGHKMYQKSCSQASKYKQKPIVSILSYYIFIYDFDKQLNQYVPKNHLRDSIYVAITDEKSKIVITKLQVMEGK